MFPLRDENPTTTTPFVTIALIVANVVVFFLQLAAGLDRSVGEFGVVPAQLLQGSDAPVVMGRDLVLTNYNPAWMTIFSSMFMHGGWLHILGNMWFLWIFGNNVEDDMGHAKFVAFYLVSGIAAAMAQAVLGPGSQIPMVGASGAIGGVLGAYLVLFPGSKVLCLITTFIITTIEVPAYIVLGLWFVMQIASSFVGGHAGGVAYAA